MSFVYRNRETGKYISFESDGTAKDDTDRLCDATKYCISADISHLYIKGFRSQYVLLTFEEAEKIENKKIRNQKIKILNKTL